MSEIVDVAADVRSLQRCINDLVSVLTLPTMWMGASSDRIIDLLLDTLADMLDLDFVYARTGFLQAMPISVIRATPSPAVAAAVGTHLDEWFGDSPQAWGETRRVTIEGTDFALVPLRLGLLADVGVLVAGCSRKDFPRRSESLLLTVATNQATIALQEAKLRDEHVRAAAELDRLVAQRTQELRASEEELRMTQAELAHMSRVTTLGELTASIAHEINQPLAGIMTNASTCLHMLAGDPPNVSGARETARRTIRDANRVTDVITRLRALFARKELSVEAVDLNEAASEVLALCRADLERNQISFRLELADDLPLVAGDRVQLQQVILNLIGNASDAMTQVQQGPRDLLLRTGFDSSSVRVTIQDTGAGFDPKDAEKLFVAFHTNKAGGMGIGLSVSRSIIRSHQGELTAISNAGQGAVFSFRIPCGAPVDKHFSSSSPRASVQAQ